MLPICLPGQVLKVTVGNIHTYVIIVPHIFEHRMGFKSLLARDRESSISVDQLQHYEVIVIGSEHSENYRELLAEMKKNSVNHLHIWELFQPEGHYNADKALAELHADGVKTSRTPDTHRRESRN